MESIQGAASQLNPFMMLWKVWGEIFPKEDDLESLCPTKVSFLAWKVWWG